MARIYAIANQKGGVGKTTTVVNLTAYLAGSGRRVLLVDMDPQANATSALGFDKKQMQPSTYQLLLEQAAVDSVRRRQGQFRRWNRKRRFSGRVSSVSCRLTPSAMCCRISRRRGCRSDCGSSRTLSP